MLTEDDKKTVLIDWNATHAALPDVCAHTLFEEQARRSPSEVAVVCGDRTLTYAELDERADHVAGYLRANGIGRESLVGVALDRSPELVVALLGVWKAGAAYVPLDPSYPKERLSFMVGDAGVKLLLTQSRHASLFESHDAPTVRLDGDWSTVAAAGPLQPRPAPDPSTLAYVMYTSGSTGQPKGAMIVHSGLVNYLTWAVGAYGVKAGGSVPVHSSIAFDLTVTSLFPALIAGGQIELLGEDVGAQRLIAALRARPGRALVKITPAHLEVITQQLRPEELAGLTQVFVIGGENLPAESLRPWRERAPGTRLINEYGPTETVVGCCIHEVRASDPDHGPVPIGRPIANTQLYVLDEERRPVGIGEMGELYIGGAGVARGYLNRPELTSERFLPDPFSERAGARLYKTGDLARYRTDGTLEFLGRADHQVKVRGYRIELGEIEAVLARHPDVQSCVVLAREDTPGDKQLVAYVVARPGRRADVDALHAFATAHLPEYMAPAHHVLLDELPLTSNGKVDRKALPAPSARREAASAVAPPANETEAAIAAILAELLKVPALGSDDDFFDKGGHSLLAIKAVARIRDELGVDLPPQTLFEHSTPAALAARVSLSKGESPATSHGIPRRKASGLAPASEGQQQLWLIDQVVPGSPAYNIVDVVTLRGKYDAAALTSALSELVARHEVLRTGLSQEGGQLVQTIAPAFTPSFEEHDLAAAGEEERLRRWSLLARDLGRRPFDLSSSPLLRVAVAHMSPTEHRLLYVIHHVVADEWSMDLIQKEVTELYAARLQGRALTLAPLPIQYADYAAWEQESLASDERRSSIEYWKKELSGAITTLALPVDKRRPSTPTMAGAVAPFDLPADLLERLKALGRREQATLFMLLEAAFAVLMHRYSGQDDVLVGTPISGRNHSETQGLVGYFLNTLVLRSRFPEDTTFRTLLRRTRETALGAFAHADLPFSRLVAAVAPARDTSRSPLFQVMFVLHGPDGVSQLAKLADRGELETGTSKFDLTLYTSETRAGLQGLFEYSTDLFDAGTIERLGNAFRQILETAVADPDARLSSFPLPAAEMARLREQNATVVEYPRESTLARLFERQAAKTPDAPAASHGAETISYRELDVRANRIAHALRRRGVGRGSIVGLALTRSVDMVAAVLGVTKAGGTYLPLDPALPPARLAFMVKDSGLSVVVSESAHAGQHGVAASMVLELDRAREELASEPAGPVDEDGRSARPEDAAYLLYTSGSTGKPKGVLVQHRAAVNILTAIARQPGCAGEDRWLAVTTLSFDIALLELFVPLITGGQVVVASREDAADAAAIQRLLEAHAITILQATPATWRMLVDSGWAGRPRMKAITGGEALAPDLAAALVPRVAELWNLYGPTETAVYSTGVRIADAAAGITIGRPLANTSVWILDPQRNPCPLGVVGEIYIGGDGVALGYHGRPDLTSERFLPDPFGWGPDSRLYRTGDLGRLRDDGLIEYLGRADFQVKIRGFRIELGEIEACLAEHPAVREVCVAVVESIAGDPAIVAYFATRPDRTVTSTDLRSQCRAALPDYMVPRSFVDLPALPRTPNGKVDRKALPAGSPAAAPAEAVVAPRTASERLVAEVWKELLGRDVGVNENFFEAGGHSLLVVRAIGAIAKRSGVQLSPRVFAVDTLAQIAAPIEARTAAPRANAEAPAAPVRAQPSGLLTRLKNRILG